MARVVLWSLLAGLTAGTAAVPWTLPLWAPEAPPSVPVRRSPGRLQVVRSDAIVAPRPEPEPEEPEPPGPLPPWLVQLEPRTYDPESIRRLFQETWVSKSERIRVWVAAIHAQGMPETGPVNPFRLGGGRDVIVQVRGAQPGDAVRVQIVAWQPAAQARTLDEFDLVLDLPTGDGAAALVSFGCLRERSIALRVDGRPCVSSYESWGVAVEPVPEHSIVCFTASNGCGLSSYFASARAVVPDGTSRSLPQSVVPASMLERLRTLALASRSDRESSAATLEDPGEMLRRLGFDSRCIEALRPRVRAELLEPRAPFLACEPELPPRIEEYLTQDSVRASLSTLLAARSLSTGSYVSILHLPGEPEVLLATSSWYPLGVPWLVSVAGDEWWTLDEALAREIERLFPPPLAPQTEAAVWVERPGNSTGLLPGIGRELQQPLNTLALERFLEPLLDESLRVWSTSARSAGDCSIDVRSATFARTENAQIDLLQIDWPSGHRLTADSTWDWRDSRTSLERAEAALAGADWLADWKWREQGRVTLVRTRGQASTDRTRARALQAWSEAEVGDAPEFELWFSRPDSRRKRNVLAPCGRALLTPTGVALLYARGVGSPLREPGHPLRHAPFVLVRPGQVAEALDPGDS